MTNKDAQGNTTMDFPITKLANVEGAAEELEALESKIGLPVGFMYFSLEKTVPTGKLPAQGTLYNRNLYADLWKYAQDNNLVISESEWQSIANANNGKCEYYSSGDGSTTFRVPKIPNTIVGEVSDGDVPVVGNGMAIGMTNGTKTGGLIMTTSSTARIYPSDDDYGRNIGLTQNGDPIVSGTSTIGLVSDPSKSGIVAKMTATKTTGQWLIVAFGTASNVGNVDVANVLQAVTTAQTVASEANNKIVGISDYIIESYNSSNTWCRKWKSGWVEQGGTMNTPNKGGSDGGDILTFLHEFASTDYVFLTMGGRDGAASNVEWFDSYRAETTTSITIHNNYPITKWYACGQGA